MTILFFTRRFYPDIGGVEKHVLEISRRLIKKGHTVTVFCEQDLPESGEKAQNYHSVGQSDIHYINIRKPVKSIQSEILVSKKINVVAFNFGREDFFKKFGIWHKIYQLRWLLASSDIVHCHDVTFWYFPFRFLLPGKKVFTTFHGYETCFPPKFSAKVVRKISEVVSIGNICVGRYIEKWYGTKADFITYGGVEIQKNKYHIVNTSPITLKIVYLGRLAEDNGVKIFLEALKSLKNSGFSFKFTAVGDGKMRKKVEKVGKVVGFTQNPQKFVAGADIIFSSSYLSMLEALILKKPVFAVYQNALKEDYLKMSPFAKYVSISNSAEELAEAILSLKRKETTAGYAWAKTQTWEKVTNLYLRLWNK